jgi:hypothetical protein
MLVIKDVLETSHAAVYGEQASHARFIALPQVK